MNGGTEMDVREKTTNEKRLIDYDEIRSLFSAQYKETVRLIHNGETHLDNLAEGFTEADRIIRNIPSVDAVEVVRCRDCKQGEIDDPDFPDEYYCHGTKEIFSVHTENGKKVLTDGY